MDVIGTKRQPVDIDAQKVAAMNAIAVQLGHIELPASTSIDTTEIVLALKAVNESLQKLIQLSQKPEQEKREIDKLDVVRDDSNHRIKTVRVHYK